MAHFSNTLAIQARVINDQENEIQSLKEQLAEAEKVIRLSCHISDEDEADIAMEYARKYFKNKESR